MSGASETMSAGAISWMRLSSVEIRRPHVLRVLSAGVLFVDERAFDMQAGRAAELGIRHVFGALGGDFLQLVLRLGERGGKPSGDAFLQLAFRDVADGLQELSQTSLRSAPWQWMSKKPGITIRFSASDHLVGCGQWTSPGLR
jgi:hypothetical protein